MEKDLHNQAGDTIAADEEVPSSAFEIQEALGMKRAADELAALIGKEGRGGTLRAEFELLAGDVVETKITAQLAGSPLAYRSALAMAKAVVAEVGDNSQPGRKGDGLDHTGPAGE